MTQLVVQDYAPGDIFHRSGNLARTFFTHSATVTANGKTLYWPSGTPLTMTGIWPQLASIDSCASGNSTSRALLYTPAKLVQGVPTKICFIDSWYNTPGTPGFPPGKPGDMFAGIKVNVSRLPLGFTSNPQSLLYSINGLTPRSYVYTAWKTALDRMGIAWFEESNTNALQT